MSFCYIVRLGVALLVNGFDLVIVTLDNVRRLARSNRKAREVFSELELLRLEGYGGEYPDCYIPLDTADFIATHHLLCVRKGPVLEAIGGVRHVLLSTLDYYQLPLGLLSSVEAVGKKDHVAELSRIIHEHRVRAEPLLYSSRFVLKPEFRRIPEFGIFFHDVVTAITCADWIALNKPRIVVGSILKFKTDRLFAKVGFHPIQSSGGALEPFVHKISGLETLLMTCEEMTPFAVERYHNLKQFIDGRDVIGSGVPVAA